MSTTLDLGDRLRLKRREKKLTQEQLAIKASTNQAVIQKIENKRSKRPRCLEQLAKALDVTPEWLQYGVVARGPEPLPAKVTLKKEESLSQTTTELLKDIRKLLFKSYDAMPVVGNLKADSLTLLKRVNVILKETDNQ